MTLEEAVDFLEAKNTVLSKEIACHKIMIGQIHPGGLLQTDYIEKLESLQSDFKANETIISVMREMIVKNALKTPAAPIMEPCRVARCLRCQRILATCYEHIPLKNMRLLNECPDCHQKTLWGD